MSTTRREEKQQERAIDRTIEETKDSAKRVLSEVRRELPEVTATFHDYQEKNIAAVRDMTNTFLESQKEIAKSFQATSSPLTNNVFTLIFMPWLHPQIMTDAYVRTISSMADSSVLSARLASDLTQLQLESTRSSMDAAQRNTKVLSQYFVESAQTIEAASKMASP